MLDSHGNRNRWTSVIETYNLSKSFKDVEAVKDVSFKVNKGEIVGLLGENGAGKTTTLRMLATMLRPTSGSASINGYDIIKDSHEVRRNIGILFGGEVGLYDRLTGRENIEYFAKLNGRSEEHTSELQSRPHLVCRLLLEKKNKKK